MKSIITNMNELKDQLKKYNWSSDKDYQLAVIAFKEILPTYTTRKELEAKEQELEVLKRLDLEFNVVICGCGEPYKDTDPHDIVKERITQLSTELSNKKKEQ